MPEDTVGYHVFIRVKALSTECWDRTKINIGNEIGRSVTVFREPRRRMTRIEEGECYVTCILADFAANLSG